MEVEKFTYYLSNNLLFEKNAKNYIDAMGKKQLPPIENVYLLDIFLSENNCVELHYHPNATELTYCIRGEVTFSFINEEIKEWQNFVLKPGEVIAIP